MMAPLLTNDVLVEQRQSALMATLNRPQAKNALNSAIVESLLALCGRLDQDREIRALVLRGAGRAGAAAFAQKTLPDRVETYAGRSDA